MSGTTTGERQPPDQGSPGAPAGDPARDGSGEQPAPAPERTGFATRGRMRRRLRFLRRARELAYRDLGGLVFDLHRFGQRNDELVLAKLGTLGEIDRQLRALECALAERREATVLREAGVTACARCAAIHSSEDRFCPNCGLALGPNAEVPIAVAAPPSTHTPAPAEAAGQPAATPAQPAASALSQDTAAHPALGSSAPAPAPARPRPGADTPGPAGPRIGRSPAPPGSGAGSAETGESTEILRPPAGA